MNKFYRLTIVTTLTTIQSLVGASTGWTQSLVAKTEAKLEFKLFAIGDSSPRLQSSASAKLEGDENSAGSAVDAEARAVAAAVKKKP